MGKWDKVHAILDREVEREVKRVLGKIKAVVGGRGNGNGHTKPIEAKTRKAKPLPSGKPTAQRQLHGKYLGLTRTLPKEQKAKLSELYKSKGVRAALAEAKRMRASA